MQLYDHHDYKYEVHQRHLYKLNKTLQKKQSRKANTLREYKSGFFLEITQ